MILHDSQSLTPKKPTPITPQNGHWQFTQEQISGKILGEFKTLQPLHVGSRGTTKFYRLDNVLTVPASSLKGAIRNLIEAFTASCIRTQKPIQNKKKHEACKSEDAEGICVACHLFGAMGYGGNIRLSDARVILGDNQEAKDILEYKNHKEAVKKGTRFTFELYFHNLSADELGLLFIALGQSDPAICFKLGANKSKDFGTIKFTTVKGHILEKSKDNLFLTYQVEETPIQDVKTYTEADNPLIVQDKLTNLQKNLNCNAF